MSPLIPILLFILSVIVLCIVSDTIQAWLEIQKGSRTSPLSKQIDILGKQIELLEQQLYKLKYPIKEDEDN